MGAQNFNFAFQFPQTGRFSTLKFCFFLRKKVFFKWAKIVPCPLARTPLTADDVRRRYVRCRSVLSSAKLTMCIDRCMDKNVGIFDKYKQKDTDSRK